MEKIYIRNSLRSKRPDLSRTRRELRRAFDLLGLKDAEVSVLFVGPSRMRSLNSRYRGKDRPTDVLSFPMEAPFPACPRVLGDIVICLPTVDSQAKEYGVTFDEELRRVLVHGLLHLLGYDHEKSVYQKRKMERKEREVLSACSPVA